MGGQKIILGGHLPPLAPPLAPPLHVFMQESVHVVGIIKLKFFCYFVLHFLFDFFPPDFMCLINFKTHIKS